MSISSRNFKQQAHELIDRMPDDSNWSDLIDYAAERQDMLESFHYSDFGANYDTTRVEQSVLQEYDRFQGERDRQEEAGRDEAA